MARWLLSFWRPVAGKEPKRKVRRVALRVLIWVAVGYVTVVAVMVLRENSFVYHPSVGRDPTARMVRSP
jgi:hypothetical protein